MKVVVTGGSGLIGRRLTALLVAEGHSVVVLSRSPERISGLPDGAVAARWNGKSAGALVPRLEGAGAVVHLAGEGIGRARWTGRQKLRIRTSRTRSTTAMADALRRADDRPPVLVQASAVGFYGPRGDEEISESASSGNDFLAAVCRDWEAASAAVESFGVRRVLLRTGVVLASEGGALPRMVAPFKAFVGGPLGNGRQWFPWIHLRDEVRAIRFLIERDDAAGAFNLTAPEPVTNRELAATLGRVLRRPSVMPMPAFVLRGLLGEMATLLLDGQRALPRRLQRLGFEFEFARLEQALRDLLLEE